MKRAAITWWILSALLVISAEGESATSNFSEMQSKALKLIMEHFHNKQHVKFGFKVTDVITALEIDYGSGIFVNLELALNQTTCHKSHWAKTDCELVKNGRKFNCFSCFKFTYNSHKILSQLVDCVGAHHVDSKRISNRNQSCKEVELKQGPDKPGIYSFVFFQ